MRHIALINESGQGFSHIDYLYKIAMINKSVDKITFLLPSPFIVKNYFSQIQEDQKSDEVIKKSTFYYSNFFMTREVDKDSVMKARKNSVYDQSYCRIIAETGFFCYRDLYRAIKFYDALFESNIPDIIISDKSVYIQAYCAIKKWTDKLIVISSSHSEYDHDDNYYFHGYVKKEHGDGHSYVRSVMENDSFEKWIVDGINSISPYGKISNFSDLFSGQIAIKAFFEKEHRSKKRTLVINKSLETAKKECNTIDNDIYLYMMGDRDPKFHEIMSFLNNSGLMVRAKINTSNHKDINKLINNYEKIKFIHGIVNQAEMIKKSKLSLVSGENSLFESFFLKKPCLFAISHLMGRICYDQIKSVYPICNGIDLQDNPKTISEKTNRMTRLENPDEKEFGDINYQLINDYFLFT